MSGPTTLSVAKWSSSCRAPMASAVDVPKVPSVSTGWPCTASRRCTAVTAEPRSPERTFILRYSPRCEAAWAKMSNTSPEDRVIITPKRGDSEEYRQQTGHDAHTRMVPVTRPEDARACAKIQDRVCATTPALSSPSPLLTATLLESSSPGRQRLFTADQRGLATSA